MDKTRREKEEASLANYFYSFPRNEFRSRREREKERETSPRCRGKIPRLKRLMAALRIQDPANGSFFFSSESERNRYIPINDTTP